MGDVIGQQIKNECGLLDREELEQFVVDADLAGGDELRGDLTLLKDLDKLYL